MFNVYFPDERKKEIMNELKKYIEDKIDNNRLELREKCQKWIDERYDFGLTKKEKENLQYKLKICDVIPLDFYYKDRMFGYINTCDKIYLVDCIKNYIQLNLFAPITNNRNSTELVKNKLNQIISMYPDNPFEEYINTIDLNMYHATQAYKVYRKMYESNSIRFGSDLPPFLQKEFEELFNRYHAEDIGTAYIFGGLYA